MSFSSDKIFSTKPAAPVPRHWILLLVVIPAFICTAYGKPPAQNYPKPPQNEGVAKSETPPRPSYILEATKQFHPKGERADELFFVKWSPETISKTGRIPKSLTSKGST